MRSLKGWQISGLGIFNSGSPLFINQDGDTLNVDSEEIRPNLVAGQDPTLPSDERSISRWFNTAAFARATRPTGPRPAILSSGRAGRCWTSQWRNRSGCMASQQFHFRVEAFNAFNWVNWGNPNGTLGNTTFGVISSAAAAREMQPLARPCFEADGIKP